MTNGIPVYCTLYTCTNGRACGEDPDSEDVHVSGVHVHVRGGAISRRIHFHFHVSENDVRHYADDSVYAPEPGVSENGYESSGISLILRKSTEQWKSHEPTEMNH